MKENVIKAACSAALAGLAAYFGVLAVPLCVLLVVMALDYISGLGKAWVTRSLCSRIGLVGILKKVGYLLVAAVGMVVDYIINSVLAQVGVDIGATYFVGLLVIVWLVVNELLSIIENAAQIGVPIPAWLHTLVERLKVTTEAKGAAMSNGD